MEILAIDRSSGARWSIELPGRSLDIFSTLNLCSLFTLKEIIRSRRLQEAKLQEAKLQEAK